MNRFVRLAVPCAVALVTLMLSFSSEATASRTKHGTLTPFPETVTPPGPLLSAEIHAQFIDRAKSQRSGGRAPANKSGQFDTLILNPFMAAKTTKELDDALAVISPVLPDGTGGWKTNPAFEKYPNDVKYFAAQLWLMRPLRSIVFRLRPLFEKNKNVQSVAVTTIRSMVANLKIYLPDSQWEAGFRYFTEPAPGFAPTNEKFATVSAFQAAMVRYIDAVRISMDILTKMYSDKDNKLSADLPFVWDKRIAYGNKGYEEDTDDRFAHHGRAELAATLSSLHMSVHSIYIFAYYNQEDMLEVYEDIGKVVGLDGFGKLGSLLRDGDFGISAYNRWKVLDQSKFRAYQSRWNDDEHKAWRTASQSYLTWAWRDLQLSMDYLNSSWESLKATGQDHPDSLMNPLNFSGFTDRRIGDARMKKLLALTSDAQDSKGVELFSIVSGKPPVKVRLKQFYLDPPSDLKMPIANQHDLSGFKVPAVVNGKSDWYRNYFAGRPTGWDAKHMAVVSKYIDGDPMVALKVMSESFGGDYLSPLADALAW